MDKMDWYNCGARIGDLVQKAIEEGDFKQLNESIVNTIDDTLDAVQKGLKGDRAAQQRYRAEHASGYGKYRRRGNAYQDAREQADVSDILQRRTADRGGTSDKMNHSAKGLASMIAGYSMAVIAGLGSLTFMILKLVTGFGVFRVLTVVLLALTALFAWLGSKGGGFMKQQKQLEQYLKIMGDRDSCTVQELADATGSSVKDVRRDLKDMMKKGMFASEAYLDEQETTLMTSREVYRQYQETMQAYRERKAQEEAAEQQRKAQQSESVSRSASRTQETGQHVDLSSYSEETRKILQEGRDFISHIRACNDAIPGEVMSEKLSRLEQVVTRIFDQVEADPQSAPDLHRMMSYYLPTTSKLVDAYTEMDQQKIRGENITKAKQEIEMSLDTINDAYEALLDSFFQDTAWDISADISTLKTMMARDGLTGRHDFAPGEHIKTVARDVTKPLDQTTVEAGQGTDSGKAAGSGQGVPAGGVQTASAGSAAAWGGSAGAAARMPED